MGLGSRATDESVSRATDEERLRGVVNGHYRLAWRLIRRLGVVSADAEDAVQQVFIVVARRLSTIEAGSERAFVVSTAVRVAADARRLSRRKPLELLAHIDEVEGAFAAPDELTEARRARRVLDELLDSMPGDVRGVFVLFEIEELTLTEIAAVLEIPRGTAASRLARARVWFSEAVESRRGVATGKGQRP